MKEAENYRRYLETLTPESLAQLSQFVTPDIHFVDPFNDVRGIDRLMRVFQDMFDSVQDIEFRTENLCQDGPVALLFWHFSGTLRGNAFSFDGMSKLRFAEDGRVCEHFDYWDSATQFYMRLPVIGWLLSFVRRRVSSR